MLTPIFSFFFFSFRAGENIGRLSPHSTQWSGLATLLQKKRLKLFRFSEVTESLVRVAFRKEGEIMSCMAVNQRGGKGRGRGREGGGAGVESPHVSH